MTNYDLPVLIEKLRLTTKNPGNSVIFTCLFRKGIVSSPLTVGIFPIPEFFREHSMIIAVNTEHPQTRHINRVVEILKKGGVIVYPTDTTYAFGCDLFNKKGVDKILAIKRMPKNKLLSLICPDLKVVSQYGYVTNQSYKMMKRCLPGPYTFILQATQLVPRVMVTKRKTIGIRIPDDRIAQAIVEALGHPLVTASVRLKSEEIMGEPYEIEERLGHLLDIVIDAGIILPSPSSVVDLNEEPPAILREGKGDLSFITKIS